MECEARPKPIRPFAPRATGAGALPRVSRRLVPVYHGAPRDISPLAFLLLHALKASAALPSTLNPPLLPVLSLPVRARENARSRRVCYIPTRAMPRGTRQCTRSSSSPRRVHSRSSSRTKFCCTGAACFSYLPARSESALSRSPITPPWAFIHSALVHPVYY
ncbi:hypothetical protein FB451DRAFT_1568474 [Mycena latifolia]|nr:hypothetical protein FB451DRAFT_1568474 [Mycena latifolia]